MENELAFEECIECCSTIDSFVADSLILLCFALFASMQAQSESENVLTQLFVAQGLANGSSELLHLPVAMNKERELKQANIKQPDEIEELHKNRSDDLRQQISNTIHSHFSGPGWYSFSFRFSSEVPLLPISDIITATWESDTAINVAFPRMRPGRVAFAGQISRRDGTQTLPVPMWLVYEALLQLNSPACDAHLPGPVVIPESCATHPELRFSPAQFGSPLYGRFENAELRLGSPSNGALHPIEEDSNIQFKGPSIFIDEEALVKLITDHIMPLMNSGLTEASSSCHTQVASSSMKNACLFVGVQDRTARALGVYLYGDMVAPLEQFFSDVFPFLPPSCVHVRLRDIVFQPSNGEETKQLKAVLSKHGLLTATDEVRVAVWKSASMAQLKQLVKAYPQCLLLAPATLADLQLGKLSRCSPFGKPSLDILIPINLRLPPDFIVTSCSLDKVLPRILPRTIVEIQLSGLSRVPPHFHKRSIAYCSRFGAQQPLLPVEAYAEVRSSCSRLPRTSASLAYLLTSDLPIRLLVCSGELPDALASFSWTFQFSLEQHFRDTDTEPVRHLFKLQKHRMALLMILCSPECTKPGSAEHRRLLSLMSQLFDEPTPRVQVMLISQGKFDISRTFIQSLGQPILEMTRIEMLPDLLKISGALDRERKALPFVLTPTLDEISALATYYHQGAHKLDAAVPFQSLFAMHLIGLRHVAELAVSCVTRKCDELQRLVGHPKQPFLLSLVASTRCCGATTILHQIFALLTESPNYVVHMRNASSARVNVWFQNVCATNHNCKPMVLCVDRQTHFSEIKQLFEVSGQAWEYPIFVIRVTRSFQSFGREACLPIDGFLEPKEVISISTALEHSFPARSEDVKEAASHAMEALETPYRSPLDAHLLSLVLSAVSPTRISSLTSWIQEVIGSLRTDGERKRMILLAITGLACSKSATPFFIPLEMCKDLSPSTQPLLHVSELTSSISLLHPLLAVPILNYLTEEEFLEFSPDSHRQHQLTIAPGKQSSLFDAIRIAFSLLVENMGSKAGRQYLRQLFISGRAHPDKFSPISQLFSAYHGGAGDGYSVPDFIGALGKLCHVQNDEVLSRHLSIAKSRLERDGFRAIEFAAKGLGYSDLSQLCEATNVDIQPNIRLAQDAQVALFDYLSSHNAENVALHNFATQLVKHKACWIFFDQVCELLYAHAQRQSFHDFDPNGCVHQLEAYRQSVKLLPADLPLLDDAISKWKKRNTPMFSTLDVPLLSTTRT